MKSTKITHTKARRAVIGYGSGYSGATRSVVITCLEPLIADDLPLKIRMPAVDTAVHDRYDIFIIALPPSIPCTLRMYMMVRTLVEMPLFAVSRVIRPCQVLPPLVPVSEDDRRYVLHLPSQITVVCSVLKSENEHVG